MQITLTEDAKKYWTKLLDEKPSAKYVRHGVKGGGCAGFSYTWDYTDNADRGVLIEDILVVDDYAEMFLHGSEIVFEKDLGGSHIQVTNPNEVSACGCGESIQFASAV